MPAGELSSFQARRAPNNNGLQTRQAIETAQTLEQWLARQYKDELSWISRIARLYEAAGELCLARERLEYAHRRAPHQLEIAEHLARVSGRQGDEKGIEQVEALVPVAAARAWCALGQPERGVQLLEPHCHEGPQIVSAWAEAAAVARDNERVCNALYSEWSRSRAEWDRLVMFLTSSALEGIGASCRAVRRTLHATRTELVTEPLRALNEIEWHELGFRSVRPRIHINGPSGPSTAVDAVSAVSKLLQGTATAQGRSDGSVAYLRYGLAYRALLPFADTPEIAMRVGMLAAVDPEPVLLAFPRDSLWLAALTIEPSHCRRLRALGLGPTSSRELP